MYQDIKLGGNYRMREQLLSEHLQECGVGERCAFEGYPKFDLNLDVLLDFMHVESNIVKLCYDVITGWVVKKSKTLLAAHAQAEKNMADERDSSEDNNESSDQEEEKGKVNDKEEKGKVNNNVWEASQQLTALQQPRAKLLRMEKTYSRMHLPPKDLRCVKFLSEPGQKKMKMKDHQMLTSGYGSYMLRSALVDPGSTPEFRLFGDQVIKLFQFLTKLRCVTFDSDEGADSDHDTTTTLEALNDELTTVMVGFYASIPPHKHIIMLHLLSHFPSQIAEWGSVRYHWQYSVERALRLTKMGITREVNPEVHLAHVLERRLQSQIVTPAIRMHIGKMFESSSNPQGFAYSQQYGDLFTSTRERQSDVHDQQKYACLGERGGGSKHTVYKKKFTLVDKEGKNFSQAFGQFEQALRAKLDLDQDSSLLNDYVLHRFKGVYLNGFQVGRLVDRDRMSNPQRRADDWRSSYVQVDYTKANVDVKYTYSMVVDFFQVNKRGDASSTHHLAFCIPCPIVTTEGPIVNSIDQVTHLKVINNDVHSPDVIFIDIDCIIGKLIVADIPDTADNLDCVILPVTYKWILRICR